MNTNILCLALASALASPSRAGLFSRPPERMAVPAPAVPPGLIVQTITPLTGGGFAVNGARAVTLWSGEAKEVVIHPKKPSLAVSIFRDHLAPAAASHAMELEQLALLPQAAAPRVLEHRVIEVSGKSTPYIAQERVRGVDLEHPTESKLSAVLDLFALLAKARVEIAGSKSAATLREMIKGGETESGGFGAYLVSPDVVASAKSERELRAIYDGLFRTIAARPQDAAISPAPIVTSLERRGGEMLVNGARAESLASGHSKDVLRFPDAPDFVVKVFRDRAEKRREINRLSLLPAASPRLINHGEAAGQAYLVQEYVDGGPAGFQDVRRLFDRLLAARLEIVGGDSVLALEGMITAGKTRSGGRRAYLVDPSIARASRWPFELRVFYEGLLGILFPIS